MFFTYKLNIIFLGLKEKIMKEINILWFKKDLRIYDNEALCEALEKGLEKI